MYFFWESKWFGSGSVLVGLYRKGQTGCHLGVLSVLSPRFSRSFFAEARPLRSIMQAQEQLRR